MDGNVFYHYTTVAGAHGIMRSRRVWLSDYKFLNDRRELKQGYECFVAALPEDMRGGFNSAFHWHDFFNHHCVLSLSRSPKILSQWRAYASDGTGMALGFDEKFLRYSKIQLIPCRYESHEAYAQKLVDKYMSFVRLVCEARADCVAENDFMDWVRKNRQTFYDFVEDIVALKNPAFTEEQEVRAIRCVELGKTLTRVSRDVIVPYLEANFWRDDEELHHMSVVLPEIWLGPKCSELNKEGILAVGIGMSRIERYDCGYV